MQRRVRALMVTWMCERSHTSESKIGKLES